MNKGSSSTGTTTCTIKDKIQSQTQYLILRMRKNVDIQGAMKKVFGQLKEYMTEWCENNFEDLQKVLSTVENEEATMKYILLNIASNKLGELKEKFEKEMDEEDLRAYENFVKNSNELKKEAEPQNVDN